MKRQHPDALLFYRMGDFYELFFEDAEKAAAALGIVLTTRGTHLGEPIKMCGVPIHAAEGYLNRLIRTGFKVAVCEQMEDPAEAKKRGSKSVVRRDVVRVVTPGTLTEDGLLDARQPQLPLRPRRRRGNARSRLGRHLHRPVPRPGDRAQGAARRARAPRPDRDPAARPPAAAERPLRAVPGMEVRAVAAAQRALRQRECAAAPAEFPQGRRARRLRRLHPRRAGRRRRASSTMSS